MSNPPENPAAAGGSPDQILARKDLSREQKIHALRQMAYDARELDVAREEGMEGPPSNIGRIHRALRELGAEDLPGDNKQG